GDATGGDAAGGDRVAVRWLDGLPPAAGYTHPPVMERLAHSRDTVCRAPGCTRAATACDCDHVVPYPHGPTTAHNTCCLCRRHHRLKTHAPHWHTKLDQNGRLVWTTPTGRVLATDPHDHRPDSPPEPEPGPPPF
ncbi:MAG: HNH endonuclease signature motif containing protein, partial [Jiangellales bacterium]